MKNILLIALLPTVFSCTQLQAQENPFTADVRQGYASIKDNVLKAADKMPASDYSFRTVQQVRTYGEMVAHVADANTRMCGLLKGETPTANAAAKTSKEELVTALKASFDYCDPVYASMTDAEGAATVKWARWEMSKLGLLNFNVRHDNEMYGIMGAFLRIKGLIPPSSESRP